MSSTAMQRGPAPEARRGLLVAVVVVLAMAALGLLWAKWLPYADRTAEISRTGAYPGSSVLDEAGRAGGAPSFAGAWDFTVAYSKAIWQALVVGLVLAAAIQALLPAGRLARALRDRGRATTAVGGAASLPAMMCTCCSAPIAATLRRQGASLPATLAFWVGNPLLNPAVLVFMALLVPWQWVGVRVLVGLLVVLAVTALVARVAGRDAPEAVPVPDAGAEEDADLRGAPARFVRALARLAVTLLPEYLLVVFLLGLLRGWLFPFEDGGGLALVLLAAVAGTLLVIPTAGEIPILLGLSAAGAGAGVIGALLITLPALSLPSMAMVGRAFTPRVTAAMGAGVAVSGVLAGALLLLLGG